MNLYEIAPVKEDGNSKSDFMEEICEGSLSVSSYKKL